MRISYPRQWFRLMALGKADEEIRDYSTVIDMPDTPAKQRVKALYNRGVAHYFADQPTKARHDLAQAMGHPAAEPSNTVRAGILLGTLLHRSGEHHQACALWQALRPQAAALPPGILSPDILTALDNLIATHCPIPP